MEVHSHKTSLKKDKIYMYRAIQLAKLGIRLSYPNPMVGAVIVHNEQIIGEGYHKRYGEAHAEVNAINSVKDKSVFHNATLYVSLEPCSHFGKTPPCCDLLVKYQFKRVVIGAMDIFEKVNGKGIKKLQANKIALTYPVLEKESNRVNKRFLTFHQQKRPYIILKWAETKDGFIDKIRNGEKGINPITGIESQIRVHQMRSQEHAILVGWKTINTDNPSLTTRKVNGENPIRIVLDAQLKANKNATVFNDGAPTIVINRLKENQIGAVKFVQCTMENIQIILNQLYQLNILSCIVEGGAATLNSFINEEIWDEAYQFVGNNTFGKGIAVNRINFAAKNKFQYGNDNCFYYEKKTTDKSNH